MSGNDITGHRYISDILHPTVLLFFHQQPCGATISMIEIKSYVQTKYIRVYISVLPFCIFSQFTLIQSSL